MDPRSRERRAELLALADPRDLVPLADRIVQDPDADAEILAGPEVGSVVLDVREPVAGDRFQLGEVLVTRTEVRIGGAPGWSMRIGDDRMASVAGAVIDAACEAGLTITAEIEALLGRVELAEQHARDTRREELAPTVVRFEDLDG